MKKLHEYISASGLAAMLILPGFSQESFFSKFEELKSQIPAPSGESPSKAPQVITEIRAVSNSGGNHAGAGGTVKTGDASVSVSVTNHIGGAATTSTTSISIIVGSSTSTEPVIKKVFKEIKGGSSSSIRVEVGTRSSTTMLQKTQQIAASSTVSATSAIPHSITRSLDGWGSRITAELRGGTKGVISRIKSYVAYVFSIFTPS